MAGEDERELTKAAEEDEEEPQEPPVPGERDHVDSAATSFLEVEQELDTMVEGMQVRGQAIDVERIPAHEVPQGFPYDVGTDDALALTLELEETAGKTVTTYFEWPAEGTDDRLGTLLQLRDVPLDRFADLHGEEVLLEVEAGHFVPVLPEGEPRGDERAYWGILAGLFPSVLIAVAGVFGALGGFVASPTFLFLWLFATLVVLPVSIYLDAWHLRTTTNWRGGPLFWAFFGMIPALNVVTTAAYLVIRQNAEPII